MLTALTPATFKSFVESEEAAPTIPLAPFTLLVGANGSGKSNLLDAIRFLQGVGLDMTISDILRGRTEGGREIWPGIRGGPNGVASSGAEEFSVDAAWEIDGKRLLHGIACRVSTHPLVQAETFKKTGEDEDFYDTLDAGAAETLTVQVKGSEAAQLLSATRSVLGQLSRAAADPSVLQWATRLQESMRGLLFLSVTPARMRDLAPRRARGLGAEGENISAVVWQMCQKSKDEREAIVDWLTELCAPEVADLAFVEVNELDEVMLELVEKDGTRTPARSLSDGTLRFLGQVVALRTAPRGSVILLEEIENGLHPQRVHLLVELLESVTRDRGVQVIATTHSPQVLRAANKQTLHDTLLFARIPDHRGTVTRRLGELPHFDEVVQRRGVEEIFATGWLERALA